MTSCIGSILLPELIGHANDKFYILQVRKTLFLLYVIAIVTLACMLTIIQLGVARKVHDINHQQTGCYIIYYNSLERNKNGTV